MNNKYPKVFAGLSVMLLYSVIALFPIVSGTQADNAWAAQAGSRIVVLPVFFIPKDNNISDQELRSAADLLQSHLKLAQEKYKALLETDTFAVSDRKYNFYHAAKDDAYYNNFKKGDKVGGGDVMGRELLNWNKDNRMDSRIIYLTIYVKPNTKPTYYTRVFAGGRTFNGPPGSGGGYIELEMASLLRDAYLTSGFQGSLVHELGHAFGLTHAACHGYNQKTNESIMSYNNSIHRTKGLMPTGGILNPEDYYLLSLNKLAFPNFTFNEAKHNPQRKSLANVDKCTLPPMSSNLGEFRRMPGKGYELFHNGKLVTGPDTAFFTFSKAKENCKWNVDKKRPNLKIECRYNGERFYPATRMGTR